MRYISVKQYLSNFPMGVSSVSIALAMMNVLDG